MKTDLRVIKTRAAIDNAFLQLLKIKPYSDISIQDIADLAIISRNTFYLHYSDKAALIEDFCNRLMKKLQICFINYPVESVAKSPEDMRNFVSAFMKSIYDEKAFVLLAMQIPEFSFVRTKIKDLYKTSVKSSLTEKNKSHFTELQLECLASGVVDTILFALTNEDRYPREDVEEVIYQILHRIGITQLYFKDELPSANRRQ